MRRLKRRYRPDWHERRLFYMLFSTEDQKEGMDAFINKRQARWQGK